MLAWSPCMHFSVLRRDDTIALLGHINGDRLHPSLGTLACRHNAYREAAGCALNVLTRDVSGYQPQGSVDRNAEYFLRQSLRPPAQLPQEWLWQAAISYTAVGKASKERSL